MNQDVSGDKRAFSSTGQACDHDVQISNRQYAKVLYEKNDVLYGNLTIAI